MKIYVFLTQKFILKCLKVFRMMSIDFNTFLIIPNVMELHALRAISFCMQLLCNICCISFDICKEHINVPSENMRERIF